MLSNLLSEYKINFYRKTTPKMKYFTGYSIYEVQRKIIDSTVLLYWVLNIDYWITEKKYVSIPDTSESEWLLLATPGGWPAKRAVGIDLGWAFLGGISK